MPSLKELKGRINSVKSTQKITKAKQMVAAAKLRRAQAAVDSNASPQIEVIEGAGLALAGLFLITPGFLTDSLGFALLIPPLRRALAQKIAGYGRARAPGGRIVIDADFEEVRPADATAPTRSLDSGPGPR